MRKYSFKQTGWEPRVSQKSGFWEKNFLFYENTWVGWVFEETVAGIRDLEPYLQSPIWCKFFILPSFQVLLEFEQPNIQLLTWSWIQGCPFQLQLRYYDLCPVANNPWFVHRLRSGRWFSALTSFCLRFGSVRFAFICSTLSSAPIVASFITVSESLQSTGWSAFVLLLCICFWDIFYSRFHFAVNIY